jgi:hypothetical protein
MLFNLIAHIKNEALLLPHWIRHHIELFDTVTIIDYASTDDSLDIIRQMAPDWRIIRSQNVDFDAVNVDFEVMQVGSGLVGWKVALNVTEYLVAPLHFRHFLKHWQDLGFFGVTGPAVSIVDKERIGIQGLQQDIPLLQQFHYAFSGEMVGQPRSRLIHRWKVGGYHPGRHHWSRKTDGLCKDFCFAWLAFAPWDQYMIERKLNIGKELSEHDRNARLGIQHLRKKEELEQDFMKAASLAVDLRKDPQWQSLVYREQGSS